MRFVIGAMLATVAMCAGVAFTITAQGDPGPLGFGIVLTIAGAFMIGYTVGYLDKERG